MSPAFTHDCKHPFIYNNDVCCSAPKPFVDKYCSEQNHWRRVNNCGLPRPTNICCPKRDSSYDCTRLYGHPNYACMPGRIFRENNKTMAALTNCLRKTCLTRDCQGPYYSMKGPIHHPPNMTCQDYSLYIPTERLLQHCKCKGNHSCLKTPRLKSRRSYNPFYQQWSDCCDVLPPGGDGINVFNFDCQDPCPNIQPPIDPCQPNGGESCDQEPKECPQQHQAPCDFSQVPPQQQQQSPCDKNRSNGIQIIPLNLNGKENEGINMATLLTNVGNTDQHSADCKCSFCTKRNDSGNGNHYPDCQCDLCHRRRNCGYVCPKITDRKAEKCKMLWFGSQKEPECEKLPTGSALANLLNSIPNEPLECTGGEDCPCAKCCKQRSYARIKPHHWYSNGLKNPDLKHKKPPPTVLENDENNNITGEKSPTSVSFSDGQNSPSGHSDSNNNKYPHKHKDRSSSSGDSDKQPDGPPECKPENSCRRPFGLGVKCRRDYRKSTCSPQCFNPEPWACWDPCAFQTTCNFNPPLPAPPVQVQNMARSSAPPQNGEFQCDESNPNGEEWNPKYLPRKTGRGQMRSSCSEQQVARAEPNDYNTTTYRQFFKKCPTRPRYPRQTATVIRQNTRPGNCQDEGNYPDEREHPPDDEGWCSGKPRYRRGRKFNEDCQSYPTDCSSFRIFSELDKRLALSRRCEERENCCPTRMCNDRMCRMPMSIEMIGQQRGMKRKHYCEEEGGWTIGRDCEMMDRYRRLCDET